MNPRERIERMVYAAVGAGESWFESATELLSDSEKRQKRVETFVKRGKKRVTALEKELQQRRKELRERLESRLSTERFEEVVEQARQAVEPLIERLPEGLRERVPQPAAKKEASSKQAEEGNEAKAAS